MKPKKYGRFDHSSTAQPKAPLNAPQYRTNNERLYATSRIDTRTLRRLEEERYREEVDECTFAPFVRSHNADKSDTMFARAEATQNEISRGCLDALYHKLTRWHAEIEECTFQPIINHDARYREAFQGSTRDIGGVDRFLRLQQQARAKKEQTLTMPQKNASAEINMRNFEQEKMARSTADIATRMKKHQRRLRAVLENILNSESWASNSSSAVSPLLCTPDNDLSNEMEEQSKAKSMVSSSPRSRVQRYSDKRGFHRAGLPRVKTDARSNRGASVLTESL